jgi:hypothetical protein
MKKKYGLVVFVLFMFVFLTGCHVDIKNDTDYPADLFKQTLGKIQAIQAKDPGRKGPVANLNLLVYAGDDRELISLSVPITTAKEVLKGVSNLENLGQGEKLEKYTKQLGGLKLEKLGFLDRMGPGLLLEAEVNEKNDFVHVLIWLD